MDSGTGTKTIHILLLENDRAHQNLVLRAFHDDPDTFRISVAGNLSDARQAIQRDPPDLIIADWILPDGKGLDILPRIDGKVTIPLVIMTSFGDEHLAVEIMKSGAIDYVVKSATVFHDLPHIVRRALRDWENIRKRKRAEAAVLEYQKRMADIIGFLPDAVLAIDNEGRVIAWNDAIERMTGVMAEDMLGKGDHEYSIPFYGVRRPILIDLVLVDDAEIEKKYDYIRRDDGRITSETFIPTLSGGKGAYVWGTASPLYDSAGNRTGAIEVIRDITDRKRAELALQASETRFKDLFHYMNAGVAIFEPSPDGDDFIFRDINRAVEKIERVRKDEVVGRSVLEVFPGVRDMGLFAVFQRVAKTGVAEQHPVSLYKDNRISGWRENLIYKLPSGEIAAIYEDVTEKKMAEEKLLRSEHRSAMLLKAIPDMMFVISREGVCRDFSVPDPAVLALPVDKIIGTNIRDSGLGKESADAILSHIGEAIRTKKLQQFEYGLTIADSRRQYEARIMAISEDEVLGIVRDITDRTQAEKKLRESEERYSSLFNRSLDCIYVTDLEGNFLDANASALDLLGYLREEIPGMSIQSLLSTDQLKKAKAVTETIVKEGSHSGLIEYRLQNKQGGIVDIETKGTLIVHDGKPFGVFGIARDISERKRAETALQESETRFRALIQNSSDIIRILDREGRIVYESSSAERILGYPPGYMIGKNPFDYIHPDDLDRVKSDLRDVYENRNTGTPTEFRIRKADGNYLWVDAIGTNLTDVSGVNGIVLTTRPIQQKKEAEQALKENEARLATAMDIAGLVNWEFDVESGMFTFDDRFYALYETTADREGGNLMSAESYMQEFVYPDDRPAVQAALRKLLATTDPGYFGQIEHRITPRDGSVRTIIARFAPVLGPDGKVIRTHGANQDITDLKLMESEIRSLNTVLEQRVRDRTEALAKTNEALEKEVAQRQEAEKNLKGSYDEKVMLLKEIHHRVKNNLQIIVSLLNLQSRYIRDESTLAAIRESQNRVKAMALVHEKLYRAEDIAHISLSDYVRFLGTGLFQFYDAKTRGIRFTLDIRDVYLDIDSAIPLGLILNELVSNSLKYAFPEGREGEVAISVKKEGPLITVLYRDNGIGIPADLEWRDTKSLGLRLVTTLVDQMNGTIDLDRSAGTQFTMVLHEKEQQGPS